MNADIDPSRPRKKEAQHSRRPAYYRNSQGRGGFNRHKYYSPEDSAYSAENVTENSEYNNNSNESGAASSSNPSSANVTKSNNFRGSSRQTSGRYQYSSPKHSNYRNNPKEYRRGNKNLNYSSNRGDPDTSEYLPSDVPNTPQRGQIVGGRYIRKQSNQPLVTNSRTYNDEQSENVETERNFSKHHHHSYKYGSSYHGSESQNHRKMNDTYMNREVNGSSNQSTSQKVSYQVRDSNRNSNYAYSHPSQSAKYQNQSAAVEETSYKNSFFKKRSLPEKQEEDNKATQRELLISRLHKGECECLVCCELIRTRDQIWHCLSCYHVFHLRCIRKWARSPAAAIEDGSWRCPACQSLNSKVPFDYYCFCGKNKNPEVNYHLTPHSCGDICDRGRPDCCSHHCKELCHPGPCPPCVVVVQKSCSCGKTTQTLPCNQSMETSCHYICEKLLNCKEHRCKSMCHDGECIPCEETVVQKCYCEKNEQSVACTQDTVSCFVYSCGNTCSRTLSCGHHTCDSVCHPGACKSCQMSTEIVRWCCCGKSSIAELVAAGEAQKRNSCQDPIPVCGKICERKLFCGPAENSHSCQSLCHEGQCPPCPLRTSMKCTCGAFTKEFNCAELQKGFVYKCEKRCNRRKDCGRHKCLNNCCTNFEHKCELVCNKKLSCGLHQCQETCHMGNCPTCWNVSFDELRCHCGHSVLYPPIACGTAPPECSQICTRRHVCDHDVKHNCHSDENCPPCTSLTTKWCYGKHKQCGPVMCFLEGVSCGMSCQKPLSCGRHKCKLICHDGECLKESEKCTQACSVPRPSCNHPCGNPCHDGPCPETPCKAQVTSTCPCGHRSETTSCFDSSKSYRLMSSTILAIKMQEIKEGQSVNLNDVLGKKSKSNKLQCNEECAVIERNKRLAVALQIQNPDLSCSPGPPSYSEFLKDEAKKYPKFVADIYEKLTSLVQLAKESKQKCRSHSFPAMNRDQRRIVHELAEFFGCETQSYDEEPKRNVVVTAFKNRCWLPFINIMAVVQRDMGIRKGPTPVLAQRDPKSTSGSSVSSGTIQKKKIDYFDYNE